MFDVLAIATENLGVGGLAIFVEDVQRVEFTEHGQGAVAFHGFVERALARGNRLIDAVPKLAEHGLFAERNADLATAAAAAAAPAPAVAAATRFTFLGHFGFIVPEKKKC